jgi:RNA polymerase sigma-70 factor (ECF subfamily)
MKKSGRFLNLPEQLIKECKQGNRKSQFELYKLYYKAMYNSSLRIIKNTTDAEDIMQEAFLKAFQHLDTYKGEVSFGAWLKKIVVNQSLDYLRKRKIEFLPIESDLENRPEEESAFQDEIDEKIRIEKVIKEVNALPDGYRIILTLYLLEGYDHDEISEILNISASTSRSQYMRAKKRLLQNINSKK